MPTENNARGHSAAAGPRLIFSSCGIFVIARILWQAYVSQHGRESGTAVGAAAIISAPDRVSQSDLLVRLDARCARAQGAPSPRQRDEAADGFAPPRPLSSANEALDHFKGT